MVFSSSFTVFFVVFEFWKSRRFFGVNFVQVFFIFLVVDCVVVRRWIVLRQLGRRVWSLMIVVFFLSFKRFLLKKRFLLINLEKNSRLRRQILRVSFLSFLFLRRGLAKTFQMLSEFFYIRQFRSSLFLFRIFRMRCICLVWIMVCFSLCVLFFACSRYL